MKKFALWILLSFAVLGVCVGGIFVSPNVLGAASGIVKENASLAANWSQNIKEVSLGDFSAKNISSQAQAVDENAIGISSAQQLFDFVQNYSAASQNANVLLLEDIDFAELMDEGLATQKVLSACVGTADAPFSGTFDGQGHTISNLKIALASTEINSYAGLFGVANGAVIKNFTLSNAEISVSGATNAYVGGVVGKGQNLQLGGVGVSGNLNFSTSGASFVCAGGLAGKIVECEKVNYIQNLGTTKLNNNQTTTCTLEYGAIFGEVQDCQILTGILARGSLSARLATADQLKTQLVGGVAGKVSGAKLQFGVVQQQFDVYVGADYGGLFALGGVLGAISQGGSELKNLAVENFYALEGLTENCLVGEIVGVVENQVPSAGNISYIHYKPNTVVQMGTRKNMAVLGDAGQYQPKIGQALPNALDLSGDNVTSTSESLSDLRVVGNEYAYFADNLAWDPLLGAWDFDEIWRVGAGVNGTNNMFLQNFYDLFIVRVAGAQNSDVLDFDTAVFDEKFANSENGNDVAQTPQYAANFKFGESVKLKFSFKKNVSATSESMSLYYNLVSLSFTPSDITKQNVDYEILSVKNGGGQVVYNFNTVGQMHYTISALDNSGENFQIEIDGICQATAGTYSVVTAPISSNVVVTSKLFDEDGNAVDEIETDAAGNVVKTPATISQGTSRGEEVLVSLSYNRTRRVSTTVRANKPYAFLGWFVLLKGQTFDDVADDQQLNAPAEGQNPSQILEILYGKNNIFASASSGYAAQNVECIFAKYTIKAYNLSFVLGDGVQRVDLFDGSVSVTESTKTGEAGVAVSQNEPSLIMEIYVSSGVTFDPTMFISSFNTYNTSDDEKFCQLLKSNILENGVRYYRFKFDMVKYKNETTQDNTIQVNVATTVNKKPVATWVWWLIGAMAVVIVALVIVFVVLIVKRRGGIGFSGGGSEKIKTSKKSFKNKNNFY